MNPLNQYAITVLGLNDELLFQIKSEVELKLNIDCQIDLHNAQIYLPRTISKQQLNALIQFLNQLNINVPSIKTEIPVLEMSCAACASGVENCLKNTLGVLNQSVSYAGGTLDLEYLPTIISLEEIQKNIQAAGYDLLLASTQEEELERLDNHQLKKHKKMKLKVIFALVLTVPIVVLDMFFMHQNWVPYLLFLLSTPVVFVLGNSFFVHAIKQLKNKSTTMDTLISLGAGTAYFSSVSGLFFTDFWNSKNIHPPMYFEASAVIITFVLLGKFLEEKAKQGTSSAIKNLLKLQPKVVTVKNKNGIWEERKISQIQLSDRILVKPGAQIPVDAVVVHGQSYVDQSLLSGEPIGVLKQLKSLVYAGTINLKGSLEIEAQKIGEQTMLSKIIKIVKKAQATKPPVQNLADNISRVFVPTVLVIALLTLVVWYLATDGNQFWQGFSSFISILVITCPCALGLAIPTALMVGIGLGAEKGILIKDALVFENANKITDVVLDKTGTITQGKPKVVESFWLEKASNYFDVFLCMEQKSEHPIASAVVDYFSNQKNKQIPLTDFKIIDSRGVSCQKDNQTFYIGNLNFIQENKVVLSEEISLKYQNFKQHPYTIIWFAINAEVVGICAVSDPIKISSQQAILSLKKMKLHVHLLTGDNASTANYIANQIGIHSIQSDVLPQEKAQFVENLQKKGKIVAMVGDGINDSAAMAHANLSVAMGKGSDIAIEVAQVTITSSDLTKIYQLLELSKKTMSTVKQNLFWAFAYNVICIPIAAGVLYPTYNILIPPMMAGFIMALSSVSVVVNSLSLKRKLK